MTQETIHLGIGELVVTDQPAVIATILGSCIAVCIYSKSAKAGGMIHFALPKAPKAVVKDDELRYGDRAIPALVKHLKEITQQSEAQFEAKVVGGAQTLYPSSEGGFENIGADNFKIAKELLAKFGIPIVGEKVGGDTGKKAIFHPSTGRLQVSDLSESTKPQAKSQRPHLTVAKAPGAKPVVQIAQPTLVKSAPPVADDRPRKVLIVDDSKTIQTLLKNILNQEAGFEVIGIASNPREAEDILKSAKPDVITLDINMPEMNGIDWLEGFLPKRPIPIVLVTSIQFQKGNDVFRGLESGAVDYIQKPTLNELKDLTPIIHEKIRSASFAKVKLARNSGTRPSFRNSTASLDPNIIVAIGSSTGGTEALKSILVQLPAQIPPTVIVQHIPPVFSKAFADRLNQLCEFEVKEAEDKDLLKPSRVLIAPGATQMRVERTPKGDFMVRINDDPPMNRHKPSVDYLFDSVAALNHRKVVGIILTGMGNDGARGLLKLRQDGAKTIGQDAESCVVYGMPRAAFEAGGVEHVCSLEAIPAKIMELCTRKS